MMRSFAVLLLNLVVAASSLEVVPVAGGVSGYGITTRYYDACKPSCAWPSKASYTSLLRTVTKSGALADNNSQSGCNENSVTAAYMDPKQQPFALDANTALGFAATGQLNGKGKKMIVQITNTGGDLASNHFDLGIPGGGVGIFQQGVSNQFGPGFNWGQQYGGVSSAAGCDGLPAQLRAGCRFRFDWMKGADNPNVSFRQVQCPAQLMEISGCRRADGAVSQQSAPVQPPPPAVQPAVPPVQQQPKPAQPQSTGTCPTAVWQQCAGINFQGHKCCKVGNTCKFVNDWFSYCVPTVPSPNGCTSPRYAQCGGKEYRGPTCCPTGTTCKASSMYYSQCL